MVYCSYTRPKGCLWSALLIQMWPRTAMMAVHEQQVTKKWGLWSPTFWLRLITDCIFILIPGLKSGATFAFSCIVFIVHIWRHIFGLFLLRLIIFIGKTSDDSAVKLRAEIVYRVRRSVSIIDFSALNLNKSYIFQNSWPGNNLAY